MGLVKGGFQRLLQTALYFLLFLCNAVILGIYSYFLSVEADRNRKIPTWEKAVEGLSGAAVLYLICATILTCCLGGITGFAIIAVILDVLFCGAMIAIAVLARHGANSCKGIVNTPLGTGPANANSGNGFGNSGFGSGQGENITYSVKLGTACRLNTAVFAVAIIAAFLFLCTAAMQFLLMRHHKKEKRLGPSPNNNYTSGYGKKGLFSRKKKNNDLEKREDGAIDGPADTTYTNGHAGYHTAPTGTATSNPYGYNNGTSTNY